MINIASYIDHTILKPTTNHIEIKKICKEALEYGFAAVCIPPPYVISVKEMLADMEWRRSTMGLSLNGVKIATVIGFPFGYSALAAKLAEVEEAIMGGADELDVVINLIALKDGNWDYLSAEMRRITEIVRDSHEDVLVKVIIESGILQDTEIIRCCEIYGALGVDFLKTSTGYAEKGATLGAVQLMRQHLPAGIRIKASGGIRDYAFARQLVEAGADRLGCSASVAIVAGQIAEGAAPSTDKAAINPSGKTGY